MKKLALPIAVGLVLAGIVHLVSVLIMPNFAERDAYSRLSVIGSTNTVAQIDDPTPFGAVLPATDPAFVTAVCLYDLGDGPLRLQGADHRRLHLGVVLYPPRPGLLRHQRPLGRPPR